MGYREDKDGSILFQVDMMSHINSLYRDGWWFEAITTLHAMIEFQMNMLFRVYTLAKIEEEPEIPEDGQPMINLKLVPIAKVLNEIVLIDDSTLRMAKKFNEHRNKCAHEIFSFKIKKKQTDEWFDEGKALLTIVSGILVKFLMKNTKKAEV